MEPDVSLGEKSNADARRKNGTLCQYGFKAVSAGVKRSESTRLANFAAGLSARKPVPAGETVEGISGDAGREIECPAAFLPYYSTDFGRAIGV